MRVFRILAIAILSVVAAYLYGVPLLLEFFSGWSKWLGDPWYYRVVGATFVVMMWIYIPGDPKNWPAITAMSLLLCWLYGGVVYGFLGGFY